MSLLDAIRDRSARFKIEDVTPALRTVAIIWIQTFSEETCPRDLRELREQVARGRVLDGAAVVPILNTLRSALGAPSGHQVPDGTYTIVYPGGASDHGWRRTLRLRTQPETSSFAPGEQIVSFLSGPLNTRDYTRFAFARDGDLQVWSRFKANADANLAVEAYRVLCGDPLGAARAYGMESGRCGLCGKVLTVPKSIEAGIGPVCASERGWDV